MYLEDLIKQLVEEQAKTTQAINELAEFLKGEDLKNEIAAIESTKSEKKAKSKAKASPEKEPEPSPEKSEDPITVDVVKPFVLSLTRGKPEMREKFKAILSEYKAAKLADLNQAELEAVYARVKEGI